MPALPIIFSGFDRRHILHYSMRGHKCFFFFLSFFLFFFGSPSLFKDTTAFCFGTKNHSPPGLRSGHGPGWKVTAVEVESRWTIESSQITRYRNTAASKLRKREGEKDKEVKFQKIISKESLGGATRVNLLERS